MPQLNRRKFFAATVLGMAAVTCPTIHARSNETIQVGMIGLGMRSRILLPYSNTMKDVHIAALCDPDTERHAQPLSRYAGTKAYTDLRRILDDKNIDVVMIAASNHWHVLAAIWAMQAGKDVYVEKPLCLTNWEGYQLVKAARKYHKICQVGTQMRSDTLLHTEVKKLLHEEKALGEIKSVRINRYAGRPSIGKRSTPLVPPATVDYNLWLGPAQDIPMYREKFHYDWHWVWNTGNGETGNWGAHLLDDCRNDIFCDRIRMPKRILSGGGRVGYNDAGETPNSMFVYYDTDSIPVVFCISNLMDDKSRSTGTFPGPDSGYIAYCEGGRYEKYWGGADVFDEYGKKIKSFDGTKREEGAEPHIQNFIEAVRQRNANMLNASVQVGYDSSFWYNGANTAWRLGEPYSKKDALALDQTGGILTDVVNGLETHLNSVGIEVNADTFKMSRFLELDSQTDTFIGEYADKANTLMGRPQYREPFVVPEI